jgi:hypothetical protein
VLCTGWSIGYRLPAARPVCPVYRTPGKMKGALPVARYFLFFSLNDTKPTIIDEYYATLNTILLWCVQWCKFLLNTAFTAESFKIIIICEFIMRLSLWVYSGNLPVCLNICFDISIKYTWMLDLFLIVYTHVYLE